MSFCFFKCAWYFPPQTQAINVFLAKKIWRVSKGSSGSQRLYKGSDDFFFKYSGV